MASPAGYEPIAATSAEPYYLQLAARLRTQITDGALDEGERLPSEGELARAWKLARSTVRQALGLLEEQGWITRVPRRGSFASRPQHRGWVLQGRQGFFEEEAEGMQRQVITHVLHAGFGPLPKSATDALHLPVDSQGYVLERVRELDGAVALCSTNYLLADLGRLVAHSDVPTGGGSLNAVLGRGGYAVGGARRSIEAVGAPGTIAERLRVQPGTPVLRVVSTSWDTGGIAFDHYEVWLLSEVVQLEVRVGSAPAPQRIPATVVPSSHDHAMPGG